jgi:uncharacterized delta-60 repeat protein
MLRLPFWTTALCWSAGALISASAASQPGGVDPTFDPGRGASYASMGEGNSVLIQPDGKILVTGIFNAVNLDFGPAAVRFNADGSRDGSFDASALPVRPGDVSQNDAPKALALQPNGQVLVAGAFINSDGSDRYLIRLNPDGSLDTAFNPRIESGSAAATVSQASVLSGGRILIGGPFNQVNGVPRNQIARLNADGSLDQTFNPATASVSFVMQSTGKVVVNRWTQLVRLNADGSLDNTFTTVTAPPNTAIGRLIVEPGDKVIWTAFQSQGIIIDFPPTTFRRLDKDGNNDATFQPFSSNGGFPVFLQADGRLIIVTYNYGAPLYRLNSDGSPDSSFHPNVFGYSFAQQADGRLVTAGNLSSPPYGIQRLFLDGARDDSFALELGLTYIRPSSIDQACLLPNGKVIITGHFNYIDRIPRRMIAVLNSNGTLDGNFDAEAFLQANSVQNSDYFTLTVQPDRKVLVAFYFDVVRLNPDGRADNSFHYTSIGGLEGEVGQLGLQPNGKILLSRGDGLLRLNSDGSVDSAFHPEQPGALVRVQPDAKILVRGTNDLLRLNAEGSRDMGFNADEVRGFVPPALCALEPNGNLLVSHFVGSIYPPAFVRLNPNGAIDPAFHPAFPSATLAAADLTGIYVFGDLAPSGEPAQLGVGRLFSDGSRDPNFAATFNSSAEIKSLLIQPDGQLLVAGSFDHVNGVAHAGIVRLNGAAPKKLANLSTRVRVGTGQRVEIGGFIITGSGPKKVIVRALGPSLGLNGVIGSETLANPYLELRDSNGAMIEQNDDWRDTQEAEIMASGIPPVNSAEAAIVKILVPGSYTAVIQGRAGGEGIALAEVYDLDPASDSSLANISTRGFVNDNDGVMIAGFILRGAESSTIVARAMGPSLIASGIADALADPTLELHNADGVIIDTNDNWRENEAEIRATGLPPANDLESALVRTLPPGGYTAIVRGKNNTTGSGLVEIYHLP